MQGKVVYQSKPLGFLEDLDNEPAASPRPLPAPLQVQPEFQKYRRESLNGSYDIGYELGKGASGRVMLAQDRVTGHYVAIKLINKYGLQEDQLVRIRREYAIMKHMEHKNFIKLLEVIENPEQICLVMEYAACGDLYTHIVSAPGGRLPEKEAREIFYQAAEGVHYLHRRGFVHRDIKPENILLGKKNHVYIADLGYGTMWESNKITNTPCGSLYYASPEIVKHDGVYIGPEVDVWSLGCVLYVMVSGRLPFHGKDADATRKLIIQGDLDFPYFVSPELRGLVNAMLHKDGMKRLDMDGVITHPWVTAGRAIPKRTLTRRRSFGAAFATFMGGLSFSKSKDALTESEQEEEKGKEKEDKKKEKKEKKKSEKAEKRGTRGRRRSHSTAGASIDVAPFDFSKYKDKEKDGKEKESKKDSKDKLKDSKGESDAAGADGSKQQNGNTKPTEGRSKGRRSSGIFATKLTSITEEEGGAGSSADAVGVMSPPTSKKDKDQAKEAGKESKKESKKETLRRKKEKKARRRMSASDGLWGLPSIAEDDEEEGGKTNASRQKVHAM